MTFPYLSDFVTKYSQVVPVYLKVQFKGSDFTFQSSCLWKLGKCFFSYFLTKYFSFCVPCG